MKIYRLLRGATLMPSFSPFCTVFEAERKEKKGDEKSLRSEQFKTHFLHRQSAFRTKRGTVEDKASERKRIK